MTLDAKTFPGCDGAATVCWYRMSATATDESGDPGARVWVRGLVAIALGSREPHPASQTPSRTKLVQEASLGTGRLVAAGPPAQSTDLVAYLHRASRNRAKSEIRRQARAERRLSVKEATPPASQPQPISSSPGRTRSKTS